MSKRLVAALAVSAALSPTLAQADSWTDGQAEWARHGSRHGAWDCYGNCTSGSGHEASVAAHPPMRQRTSRASYDGTWVVSADGPCSGAGSSQVMISSGRIMGQNGGGGHVSPAGVIDTVSNVQGMTIVGRGQIFGRTASGVYRQSDGCSSSWSAVKL